MSEDNFKVVNEGYCSEPNCDRKATVRGFCKYHYYKKSELNLFGDRSPCLFEGCEKFGIVKGLCDNHYRKLKREDALPKVKEDMCKNYWGDCQGMTSDPSGLCKACLPKDLCTIRGCDKVAHARGVCGTHYQRLRRMGEFDREREELNQLTERRIERGDYT